jgi:hypothetical protein
MNGQVTRSQVRREDGRETTTTYEAGVRRAVEAVDTADVEDWARIERSYDGAGRLSRSEIWDDDGSFERKLYFDGTLTSHAVRRDDGRETTTTYVGGRQYAVEAVDNEDVETWARIERIYDDKGRVAKSEVWNDDGFRERKEFSGGTIDHRWREDGGDSFEWERFAESFDESGRMKFRGIAFDDGIGLHEYFDRATGILETRYTFDGADSHDWHIHREFFDGADRLASERFEMDDGRMITTQFENGVRRSEREIDIRDAYDWNSIDRAYDDGGALLQEVYTMDAEIGL